MFIRTDTEQVENYWNMLNIIKCSDLMPRPNRSTSIFSLKMVDDAQKWGVADLFSGVLGAEVIFVES